MKVHDIDRERQIDDLLIDALHTDLHVAHEQIAELRSVLADLAADYVLLKTTAAALIKQLSDANGRNRKHTERIHGLLTELRALRSGEQRAA